MQHSFRTSDGLSIAYHQDCFAEPWRPAEVVLMLHSMMGDSRRFFQWVPPLSAHYDVVRMDMRGHGQSELPSEETELSVERLSQDVLELFAHLKVKSAHVIANSAGGYVAQKLAMRAPECVKSLMLYGSTPGLKKSGTDAWIPLIEKEGLGNFLARTIADRFPLDRVDPALVKWFLQETSKCDQRFICRWLGVMTALDMSDELHKIVCPTLIVRAGGETVGGADHYDVMLERIGDAEMLTYAGLPHNICDIVPQRCIQDALAFLDRRFPAS